MVTRQNTTDKTTWDAGFNKGKPAAATHIAVEDFAGYYELICEYQRLIEDDQPRRFYIGYIEGCRAAMREYATELGKTAA